MSRPRHAGAARSILASAKINALAGSRASVRGRRHPTALRMKPLLGFAHAIDRLNSGFGLIATWLVLAATLVSAINATTRYAVDMSSNAWLELQWYMFAGIVMLGAPVVLRVNEHVRVDVIYGKLPNRTRAWIDLLGMIFFLLPGAILIGQMAWPWFVDSWINNELSSNAGGLARWPAKLAMPLGFALLVLQGIAEIIKRVAYLAGVYQMDTHYERPLQ